VTWLSRLGQRLLAVVVISPAVAFAYLGFAVSAWWFVAAVAYPVVAAALLWFLIPDDDA